MPLKRGIFFPFNKEMHSIARFENMLSVDVEGFYDVKYIGNIGRKTSEVIGEVYGHDYIIENYLNINWESSFDSVILGHTLDLSRITNINFEKYFIESASTAPARARLPSSPTRCHWAPAWSAWQTPWHLPS